jgi:hypothetical protein
MAKILSVELEKIPKHIIIGDEVNDITIITKIEFHELDMKLEMPYCLHVFVYDIHGEIDAPVMLPNWDESVIIPVSMDRKDDFLGKVSVLITATESIVEIETPMALKLGSVNREYSPTSRKFEVFATVAPVLGRVSKYSEPFTSSITY